MWDEVYRQYKDMSQCLNRRPSAIIALICVCEGVDDWERGWLRKIWRDLQSRSFIGLCFHEKPGVLNEEDKQHYLRSFWMRDWVCQRGRECGDWVNDWVSEWRNPRRGGRKDDVFTCLLVYLNVWVNQRDRGGGEEKCSGIYLGVWMSEGERLQGKEE